MRKYIGTSINSQKKKKRKQVERQKDADDAGQGPQQIEMEESHPFGDLGPGGEHRHDAESESEEDQQQAQAVHAEMKRDAELRNPGPDRSPRARRLGGDRRQRRNASAHSIRTNARSSARTTSANQRGQTRSVPFGEPREHAANEEGENEPEQDHANTRMAMRMIEPHAIPAAYQRTCPGLRSTEQPVDRAGSAARGRV